MVSDALEQDENYLKGMKKVDQSDFYTRKVHLQYSGEESKGKASKRKEKGKEGRGRDGMGR